tara:strand:- start:3042 stop:3182 length:141 start_codon:yes stop_codon:yes gene_type:complete
LALPRSEGPERADAVEKLFNLKSSQNIGTPFLQKSIWQTLPAISFL